jgi:hypothetical protein
LDFHKPLLNFQHFKDGKFRSPIKKEKLVYFSKWQSETGIWDILTNTGQMATLTKFL